MQNEETLHLTHSNRGSIRRTRGKAWMGTIWNQTDKDYVEEMIRTEAEFGIISADDHTEQGQLHWHCLLIFPERIMGSHLRTQTTHWEVPHSRIGAYQYCREKGEHYMQHGNFQENGGTAQSWKLFVDECKVKTPREMIDGPYSKMYARYRGFAGEVNNQFNKGEILQGELQNEWYWGPPGTGKTKKAWDENPRLYVKSINKWWDGYNKEDVVLIDDWDPNIKGMEQKLKTWSDRYPFMAEIKGGSMRIRPKKIIITSNYSPDDCFSNQEDRDAIRRRFRVTHFTNRLNPS